MTELALLVGRLWRAMQACVLVARFTGWRSVYRWARILGIGAIALAWSLRWAGAIVLWDSAL